MVDSEKTLVDILGQEIHVGDFVVWPTMSGRSVSMTYGQFKGLNDKGSARVLPLQGSRWKRGGEKRYIDSRTGKGVYTNSKTHQAEPEYYVSEDGSKKFTREEYQAYAYEEPRNLFPRDWQSRQYLERERRNEFHDDKRIPPVMKDYVVLADEGETVTIQIVENIIKVQERRREVLRTILGG